MKFLNSFKELSVELTVFIVPIAVVWEIMVRAGFWSPAVVAAPSEIIGVFPDFLLKKELSYHLFYTVLRTLTAFSLGILIGLPLGFFVNAMKFGKASSESFVDFLRSIPGTALVPLFLIIFGPTEISKVALGAYGATLLIAISIISGSNEINADRSAVVSTLGLSPFKRIFYFLIPELALPFLVGLRAASSLTLVLIIVAEMIGGSNFGLGVVISDSRYSGNIPILYAAIVITGIVGMAMNYFLILIRRHLVHWNN